MSVKAERPPVVPRALRLRDDDHTVPPKPRVKVAVESTETEVSSEQAKSRLRFRGDIEGLRGVAIGIGVIGHLIEDYGSKSAARTIPAMDIFFAMSGFLITSLLVMEFLQTKERSATGQGTISLWRFYERRARRILPAALFVNACILIAGWLIFNPLRFREIRVDSLWSAVWVENFQLIRNATDYFSQHTVKSPFQHYWSLAVEEQFYLFWPAIFLLVARFTLMGRFPLIGRDWRRRLMTAIVLIGVPSIVVSVITSIDNPAAAYFSTFNRAWIILLGAAAAILPSLRNGVGPTAAKLASWTGAALIVASLVVTDYGTPYPGAIALFPAVGTTLLMVAGVRKRAETPVTTFLESTPVRFTGRISYSLYLWHWPIIVFADVLVSRATLGGWQRFVTLGVVSILVSWASARFIELPFHQVKRKYEGLRDSRGRWSAQPSHVVHLAAMAFVALATLTTIGLLARQKQDLWTPNVEVPAYHPAESSGVAEDGSRIGGRVVFKPPSRPAWRRSVYRATSVTHVSEQSIKLAENAPRLRSHFMCADVPDEMRAYRCAVAATGGDMISWPARLPATVAVVGNSVSYQWSDTLVTTLPAGVTVIPLTAAVCDLSLPPSVVQRTGTGSVCGPHNEMVFRALKRLKPGIIFASFGPDPTAGGPLTTAPERYKALLKRLKTYSRNVLFYVPTPILPRFENCLPREGTKITGCNITLPSVMREADQSFQKWGAANGITVMSGTDIYCTNSTCPAFVRGYPLRGDAIHLSSYGAWSGSEFLRAAVTRALR